MCLQNLLEIVTALLFFQATCEVTNGNRYSEKSEKKFMAIKNPSDETEVG